MASNIRMFRTSEICPGCGEMLYKTRLTVPMIDKFRPKASPNEECQNYLWCRNCNSRIILVHQT